MRRSTVSAEPSTSVKCSLLVRHRQQKIVQKINVKTMCRKSFEVTWQKKQHLLQSTTLICLSHFFKKEIEEGLFGKTLLKGKAQYN
jgi:hypothetical protein